MTSSPLIIKVIYVHCGKFGKCRKLIIYPKSHQTEIITVNVLVYFLPVFFLCIYNLFYYKIGIMLYLQICILLSSLSFVFKKREFAGKKMSVFIWHTEKELISVKCLLRAGLFMYVISCNLTLSHMKDPLQKACESYPTSQQGRVQLWWPDSQHRSFLFPTAHLGPHCASFGL